jgi:hypothetical protein
MGGWGSGRSGGKPLKEHALVIDLALLFRKGWLREGCTGFRHRLTWERDGQPHASISYDFDLRDPDNASLTLNYSRQRHGEDWRTETQRIRLTYTRPPYGGRRWWMICPVRAERIGKLYLPAGGDIFAGRTAWRLAYRSQRAAGRDRAFERLFRLQRRLGGREGWEEPLSRPKGMWRRTYERLEEEYWVLDAQCAEEMARMMGILRGIK